MGKHFAYLKYILRHKWYVMIECWKLGLYWRGITHDMSKFYRVEWGPYVERFYGAGNSVAEAMQSIDYQYAWNHHQKRNDHHWQHWMLNRDNGETLTLPMSDKARREMLADWLGMGRLFGTDTAQWYKENEGNMQLHPDTRAWIESQLGLNICPECRQVMPSGMSCTACVTILRN